MKKLTEKLREQWEDMMRNSNPPSITTEPPYINGKDNAGMFLCHGNRLDRIDCLIKILEVKCREM